MNEKIVTSQAELDAIPVDYNSAMANTLPIGITISHTPSARSPMVYGFTTDPAEDCGRGIHMATLGWSAGYGRGWGDIALLELEADADEIVVPLYETGKVRAPKALVIREVPLEEAGKILAKRRKNG